MAKSVFELIQTTSTFARFTTVLPLNLVFVCSFFEQKVPVFLAFRVFGHISEEKEEELIQAKATLKIKKFARILNCRQLPAEYTLGTPFSA